eukprot:XP_017455400.1 PREDICTED: uncharacterized protein LOC108352945 [Rattus norvegicus]
MKFQRTSPLTPWQGTWQHTGRHDAREVARVLQPDLRVSGRERHRPGSGFGNLKGHSRDISFNKATPTRPHLLFIPSQDLQRSWGDVACDPGRREPAFTVKVLRALVLTHVQFSDLLWCSGSQGPHLKCASPSRLPVTFKLTTAKDVEKWSSPTRELSGCINVDGENISVSFIFASVSFSNIHPNNHIAVVSGSNVAIFRSVTSCVRWLKMSLNPLLLQNYSPY